MAAYDQRPMTKEAIPPCDNQLRLLRESEHLNFNFLPRKPWSVGNMEMVCRYRDLLIIQIICDGGFLKRPKRLRMPFLVDVDI